MRELFRGIGFPTSGPTLRSIRRLRVLIEARDQINRRAAGIDGIRPEAYLDPLGYLRWDPNLLCVDPELEPVKAVQAGLVYGSLPDATVEFPVKGRSVECGTVANRIAEFAIARKLSASLDRHFNEGSWGYRPRRSPEIAIRRVRDAVRNGAHWALKTDIASFFRNVDRTILECQLRDSVADKRLCEVVLNATSPVVVIHGASFYRQNGLPQGNGIAPILSNLYLHRFDEACGGYQYFRYADDILVLGDRPEEVRLARRFIGELLGRLGLQASEKKTRVCDLYRQSVVFLGYELRGGNVWPPVEAIRRFERKLNLRGLEHRSGLMKSFARRYSVGPVRKLFRRLDRRLRDLYPPGLTLTGLLEVIRISQCARGQ